MKYMFILLVVGGVIIYLLSRAKTPKIGKQIIEGVEFGKEFERVYRYFAHTREDMLEAKRALENIRWGLD